MATGDSKSILVVGTTENIAEKVKAQVELLDSTKDITTALVGNNTGSTVQVLISGFEK